MKRSMIKCYETNTDIYMSLLQVRSILVRPTLPSLAMLLFNILARGLLLTFSRQPIMCDNDETDYPVLRSMQPQLYNETDNHVLVSLFPDEINCSSTTQDRRP